MSSYFVFDGENYAEVETLGEAMKEARDAIECYADQCDPTWPDQTENIAYGIVLGGARASDLTEEELKDAITIPGYEDMQYVKYEIVDLYSDHMKAAAEDTTGNRYGYCELVQAIDDQGMTILPGLLATTIVRSIRAGVFKSARSLMRFTQATLVNCGAVPKGLPSMSTNPEGLHRRYHIEYANGEPVDPRGVYWVLRLDSDGDDPVHLQACRVAARAYADFVNGDPAAAHLAQMGVELRDLTIRYDLEQAEKDSYQG